MELSKTLKERREVLNISQTDLAEISGTSLATIKDIERDKANPSVKTLEKIAETLGLELTLTLKRIE